VSIALTVMSSRLPIGVATIKRTLVPEDAFPGSITTSMALSYAPFTAFVSAQCRSTDKIYDRLPLRT